MRKQNSPKKKIKKEEIIGSETILERIKKKTPWIFGKALRKPKIKFPKFRYPKFSLLMPPRSLITIAVFIALFVLQTGIVYLIIRKPPAFGADEKDNPMFIWKDNTHEAFIIESIVASIFIFFFSLGFILLYHSSKYVYNKRIADWFLVIGILMIILAFTLLQAMLNPKVPKWDD